MGQTKPQTKIDSSGTQVALFVVSATEPVAGFRGNWGVFISELQAYEKAIEILESFGPGSRPEVSVNWISEQRYIQKWQTKFGPI